MTLKHILWIGISMAAGAVACQNENRPEYILRTTAGPVTLDGSLGAGEWDEAERLADFRFPWLEEKAPLTEFFASTDGSNFNFAFRVADDSVIVKPYQEESDVAAGDRVELFFARERELKEYFCLEIDPEGNVLDYSASFYRKFNDSWDCPGLRVAAGRSPGGYIVEGSIPLETLKKLGVYQEGAPFLAGLYRGERVPAPAGETETTGEAARAGEEHIKWISWVNPAVPEPDFHIPSSFGYFRIAGK